MIGGVGLNKADVKEGCTLAGTKQHNADFGCRMCLHPNLEYDIPGFIEPRTLPLDRAVRLAAENRLLGLSKTKVMQVFGIHEGGAALHGIAQDPFRQTPFDIFHMEFLGLCKRILSAFVGCLRNTKVLIKLNERLQAVQRPSHWKHSIDIIKMNSKGPEKGSVKGTGLSFAKWFQILPFALRGWLSAQHIKPVKRNAFEERFGNDWMDTVIKCLTKQGELNAELFRSDHDGDAKSNAQVIQALLKKSRQLCVDVFGGGEQRLFKRVFNIHGGVHHAASSIDLGGSRHTDCARYHILHTAAKTTTYLQNQTTMITSHYITIHHYTLHQYIT